jgi:hypothetical protein
MMIILLILLRMVFPEASATGDALEGTEETDRTTNPSSGLE